MISLGRREGQQSGGLERDDWEEGGGWEKGASEPKLSEVTMRLRSRCGHGRGCVDRASRVGSALGPRASGRMGSA